MFCSSKTLRRKLLTHEIDSKAKEDKKLVVRTSSIKNCTVGANIKEGRNLTLDFLKLINDENS